MWLNDPANLQDPFRSNDASGRQMGANHFDAGWEKLGGNICCIGGHIIFRKVGQTRERVHAYTVWQPCISY